MNDYGRGAFEALSWVRRLIRKQKSMEGVKEQVDVALERLREGSAVEFGERIKFAEAFPQFDSAKISKILPVGENLSWRNVKGELYEHRPAQPVIKESATPSLPHNEPATPQEIQQAYNPTRPSLPEAGKSGPEQAIHLFLARVKLPYISEVPTETDDGKPAKPDFVIHEDLILET